MSSSQAYIPIIDPEEELTNEQSSQTLNASNVQTVSFRNITVEKEDLFLYVMGLFFPMIVIVYRVGFLSFHFWLGLFAVYFMRFPFYAHYVVFDTSYITGSERGTQSRVNWKFIFPPNRSNADVENQILTEGNRLTPELNNNSDPNLIVSSPLNENLLNVDEQPPSYELSTSASPGPSDANRNDSKQLGDHKLQHP